MASHSERYELTLFVSGASELSARAIADAQSFCDVHLHGRHQLSVVDVHKDARLGAGAEMIATPTLVRDRPLPVRKVVGDLSRTDRILTALDVARSIRSRRAADGRG
jgi:circadian clock protein KaiB